MPSEWDAYLLRMGRKNEIGAGAANEFNLDDLCWTEIGGADKAPSDRDAAESKQRPAMTQMQGASGRADIKEETRRCPGNERAAMDPAQTDRAPEHVARSFPERARQFMPFAALKGYEEMLAEVERETTATQAGPKKFILAKKVPQQQKTKRAGARKKARNRDTAASPK